MSAICPCSLSSCFRTDAAYCAFAGLEAVGFELFFVSPTTEIAPLALGMSSLVQTFFGFLVSAGDAGSCEVDCGGAAELSSDSAAPEKPAQKAKIITHKTQPSIKP